MQKREWPGSVLTALQRLMISGVITLQITSLALLAQDSTHSDDLGQKLTKIAMQIVDECQAAELFVAGRRVTGGAWPHFSSVAGPVIKKLKSRYPRLFASSGKNSLAVKALAARVAADLSQDAQIRKSLELRFSRLASGEQFIVKNMTPIELRNFAMERRLDPRLLGIANNPLQMYDELSEANSIAVADIEYRLAGDSAIIALEDSFAAEKKSPLPYFYQAVSSSDPKLKISAYTAALEIDSSFVEARYNRAVVRARSGAHYAALNDYEQVLLADTLKLEVLANRGQLYASIKHFEAALADLYAALELTEEVPDLEFFAAQISMVLKRPDHALKHQLKGLAAAYSPDLRAREYGNLAWIYLLNNDYERAVKAAEEALALDQYQLWIYTYLAHSFLLNEQLDEAKELYLSCRDLTLEHAGGNIGQTAILDDLYLLENAGIDHPEFETIRRMMY